MHLTNYSLNKTSDNYEQEPENVFEPNNASKRTLTCLYKQLEMMKGGSSQMVEELKMNIKSACANTLSMFVNEIEHLSNPKGAKFAGRPF